MEASNQKISFFKRLKIAIFKLEDYGFFLGERFKVSLKYFFILVLILSSVMSIIDTYSLSEMVNTAYEYIEKELPDFSYAEGKVNFNEKVDAYDHEYQFKLLIDTTEELSEEQIEEYKKQMYNEYYGVLVLQDKFIYMIDGIEEEYAYTDFFTMTGLSINNKSDLQSFFSKAQIYSMSTAFFLINLFILYISNFLTIFTDLILVALFGIIASRFCGLRFKFAPMLSLAIYSMSLSIILTGVYSVVYALTGFVINYFSIMYLLIAYVYIMAAILMIKYDLIKQHYEIEKILEVQKEVHEELKEQDEKKEQEKKEENKEETDETENPVENTDEENREPDGSEI